MPVSSEDLETFYEFLRIPSVSADPARAADMRRCAQWLAQRLEKSGLEARARATGDYPVVVARSRPDPAKRTVLIYGHYDVQPPDPLEEWAAPPFEPQLREGRVYARGATDNKGQVLAHILGVEKALREKGTLPVNVIFLIEGEEECGSAQLGAFLTEHRQALACDAIVISDTGMAGPGRPALTYGLRGILSAEVRLFGAKSDLHSGIYGGVAPNPASLLAQMVAGLHDEQWRVAIPGFYDAVLPLAPWEREEWARLPLSDAFYKESLKLPALLGEAGYTGLECAWGRPTAEVNGIGGGYQGPGGKTVIPREAFAKLSFRLVPDQDPNRIAECVRAHLQKIAPPQVRVEIEIGHGGEPLMCDPHSPDAQAACRAAKRVWGVDAALIREGGSIPIVHTLRASLGAEVLLLGLALPDAACHAPNENFPLENLAAGIRLNRALLEELASV